MNIFRPYFDFTLCAEALDNSRLGKQAIELIQIVSTASYIFQPEVYKRLSSPEGLTKASHSQHPLIYAVWNYKQVGHFFNYWLALEAEYEFRFSKTHGVFKRTNAFSALCEELSAREENSYPRDSLMLNFARHQAQDVDFTFLGTTLGYQAYLSWKWDRESPKWTNRPVPEFYQREEKEK